jgi:hypothetical protein
MTLFVGVQEIEKARRELRKSVCLPGLIYKTLD